MGIVINNFSAGWQNKARPELMKDDAVFMLKDVSLDDLGALKCRNLYLENSYFATQTIASMIKDLYIVDVEGVTKHLILYTVGDSLFCYNSSTQVTRTLSTAMVGNHVSYAPLKPVIGATTYVFITDGISMLSDNGVGSKTWGIDSPTNLPIVSMAGSGGNLAAGDYVYSYTFYDEDTGAESDPSISSSATTAGANDSATLTSISVSSDSRVTKRRVYRTLVDGGTQYLAGNVNDNVSTTFFDTKIDADLTTQINTDQGIPPIGDMVVTHLNRLFLAGSVDYPNRVWFSRSERPDNWPSTYYLDVGTSDDSLENMVVFEGKLYFIQTAGIAGMYGSDSNTFAWHQTRSHVGTVARWSTAVGPDGIYFLAHDGVYRFDGLKSVRISDAIDRSFGLAAQTWVDVVDTDTVSSVARACFLLGVYYLLIPMKDTDGTVTNTIIGFDVFDQTWTRYSIDCGSLTSDAGRGRLYAGIGSGSSYSIYELFSSVTSTIDSATPDVITKSFTILPKDSKQAVGWVRKFRADCTGAWTLYFYVDGELEHTQALTNQSASTRYQWYDFDPQMKGRYLFVRILATGTPTPLTHAFNELEIL